MNFMRSHKMNLTVIILIITVIATGLLVYKHVISVKNRQDYVRVADTLRKAVLEIKKNEKNFLLQKSEERYKHLQASTYALSNTLDKIPLKTMMEISEEDFLTLRRSIHEYSQLSVGLNDNYHQKNDIVEQVREEGRKLEVFVATGKHAKELTTAYILEIRRLEEQYVLAHDNASFAALYNLLLKLKNITPFCMECSQYIEAVKNLFSINQKIDSQANELQATGNKLEEITKAIYKIETK